MWHGRWLLPIVEIELRPGKWVRLEVTYEERREILRQSHCEQRFIDATTGDIKITYIEPDTQLTTIDLKVINY